MKHLFVCEEHEDYGINGWRLQAKPYFDPAQGMQVAHDVMEEFPDGQDQPHDECMALGACVLVRSLGGYHDGHRLPPAVHLASEFHSMMSHAMEEGGYHLRHKPHRVHRLEDDYAESIIRDIGPNALKHLREYGDVDESWIDAARSWMPHALDWFRIGFRRAQRRYRGLDSYTLCGMFREIEERADKLLRHAELGYVLEVSVSVARASVRVELQEPDYDW